MRALPDSLAKSLNEAGVYFARSKEKTTSSAGNGAPPWNHTPRRRLDTQRVGSGVSPPLPTPGARLYCLSYPRRCSYTIALIWLVTFSFCACGSSDAASPCDAQRKCFAGAAREKSRARTTRKVLMNPILPSCIRDCRRIQFVFLPRSAWRRSHHHGPCPPALGLERRWPDPHGPARQDAQRRRLPRLLRGRRGAARLARGGAGVHRGAVRASARLQLRGHDRPPGEAPA